MRAKWCIAAMGAAFVAACASPGDGRVAMEVAVEGLTAEQNFCFTWQLFQLDEESQQWALVDEQAEPVCGQKGSDKLSSIGTCFGDRRFVVAYTVSFFNGETRLGTATGTSGGHAEDVCKMNYDTPSYALFQFGNEGDVGGVNPGIVVDQVCSNDKVQEENGKIVTALWLQPDECGPDAEPDSYCVIGFGEGLSTTRFGVTSDGKVRYVFGESAFEHYWNVYYLAFEPTVAAGALVLQHNPWILGHHLAWDQASRSMLANAVLAYRFEGDPIGVGLVYYRAGHLEIGYDHSGDCNGPITLDAKVQVENLTCDGGGAPKFMGGIATGGSTFELVLGCAEQLMFIGCDAAAVGEPCLVP